MTDEVRAALDDLLAVHAVSDVTPAKIQMWQTAARALLMPLSKPERPRLVPRVTAVDPPEDTS
jgi:hypothetical protein